jgi:hypothetical protein
LVNIRFGHKQTFRHSFDHLVGAGEQMRLIERYQRQYQ